MKTNLPVDDKMITRSKAKTFIDISANLATVAYKIGFPVITLIVVIIEDSDPMLRKMKEIKERE